MRALEAAAIISIALFAFTAQPALGAEVIEPPSISGDPAPRPGDELGASTGSWTPASADTAYDWLRCTATAGCLAISGACGRRYTVRSDDVGAMLRARLTVSDSSGQASDAAESAPTLAVLPPADPYAPFVGPSDTCVEVTPTGPGKGTFTSGEETGSGTVPPPETSLNFIDPFPVIRISGRFNRGRTKLTRVTVNAPKGARVRVRCAGRGCPYRRKALAVKLLRIRKLQRTYRPKATIEIRVTQPRKIGKYTRIRTRKGKAPLRVDRCLMPGKTRPVRCPTA